MPVKVLEDCCLFGIYVLSLILKLHLEKTKRFSALPTSPTRSKQKAFYLKAQQKVLGFNHKHECLKLQKFPQHSAFITQMDFPSTITTPNIGGNTTFNHTPVVSQCILIADQNSTALLLANRTDRPEVKTTAFSV